MNSLLASSSLSPRHTERLFYIAPALAAGAGLLLGNVTASAFALLAFLLWATVSYLMQDLTQGGNLWARGAKLAPWLVLALGIAVLLITPLHHAAPKLAYSTITLAIIVGLSARGAVRWTDPAVSLRRSIAEAAASLILVLWLISGDSNWYLTIVVPYGVPDTIPYLLNLPPWWWLACLVIPALAMTRLAASSKPNPAAEAAASNAFGLDPALRSSIAIGGVLCVLLMTLFQAIDFILPRFGRPVLEGDEFGYVVSAYQLLEQGIITPPHMPLISLYIAAVFALAGDNPAAVVLANVGLLVGTVALLMGAVRFVTSDLRVVLLTGILLASLRTLYLYIWSPLTETLNNSLWAAAIFLLIAAIRRPAISWHVGLGFVISLLLLARSQNLGGVVGLGLAYFLLVFLTRENRQAISSKIAISLMVCTLVATSVLLIGWGYYRQITTGKFQIMDGRGAEVLLGMNTPGVRYGLSAHIWVTNVEKWKAENPNGQTRDMLLAALKYRVQNPQETAHFLYYRALEFLNLRFMEVSSRYANAIKPNFQLFIMLGALAGLFAFRRRWLPTGITIIFLSFMGIFLIIYSEARYRIPMDPLLSIGVAAFLARLLFQSELKFPLRTVGQHKSALGRFFAVTVACGLLIGGMRILDVIPTKGAKAVFAGAELTPIGAKIVSGPPVDLKDFDKLPTWEQLLQTKDAASLQGKMFRGRFGLVGSLFKENLVLYENNGVPGAEIYSHAIPQSEFYRANSTAQPLEGELPYQRMGIAFDGAAIESGIKLRGVFELVGRVRPIPIYYEKYFKSDGFLFIDAVYAVCSEDGRRQMCAR